MAGLPLEKNFQNVIAGKATSLYYLVSGEIQVAITNYGARIVSLLVKNGENYPDVIAGFETLEQYLSATEYYHGAIIGRYANRIANGRFAINDQVYHLATNNGPNHLHGGIKGFH